MAPIPCYPRAVINRAADPRTGDRIAFELLLSGPGGGAPKIIGRAVFDDGRTSVQAEDRVAVSVRELLERPFVDRVQADERPRGYRRSARGQVDFLVPGMAEHFIARLRGLWLSYPDGTVVTAREETPDRPETVSEPAEPASSVSEPSIRRGTLEASSETAGGPPLVRGHAPLPGTGAEGPMPMHRTDCGWIV